MLSELEVGKEGVFLFILKIKGKENEVVFL